MLQEKTDVKSKSKKVGEATYPVYENVDEAVEKLGAEALLKALNAQIRTNALNAVRSDNVVGPVSKTRAMKQATHEMVSDMAAIQRFGGDPAGWEAEIDRRVAVIMAEGAAGAAEAVEAGEPSDELDELD